VNGFGETRATRPEGSSRELMKRMWDTLLYKGSDGSLYNQDDGGMTKRFGLTVSEKCVRKKFLRRFQKKLCKSFSSTVSEKCVRKKFCTTVFFASTENVLEKCVYVFF